MELYLYELRDNKGSPIIGATDNLSVIKADAPHELIMPFQQAQGGTTLNVPYPATGGSTVKN